MEERYSVRLLLLCFCVLSIQPSQTTQTEDAPDLITEITEGFFDLVTKEDTILVLFYTSERQNYLAILPELRRLSEETGVKVVKVSDLSVSAKYGVSEFPSLVFFRRGYPVMYDGDGQVMTFEELDDWLDLASAVATQVLTDDTFEHETQAASGATTGDWLVHFFKPSCDTHLPSIEAAALRLKGRKNIAKIDMESSPKLVERFQLTRCPTTIYFRHGRMFKYDMEKYDTKSLIAFVETWHKNVRGESVKVESTSFDHITESIAKMIKTQLEGENRMLFLVSGAAMSGLLLFLLVCCCCCGKSSDKAKTE